MSKQTSYEKSTEQAQIIDLETFDPSTLFFRFPTDKKQTNKFGGYSIQIFRKTQNGQQAVLLQTPTDIENDVPASWCFSFGLSLPKIEGKSAADLRPNMTFSLFNKDNPTDYQRRWLELYKEKIVEPCKLAILEHKEIIGKKTLTATSDALTAGQFSRIRFLKKNDVEDENSPAISLKLLESMTKNDPKTNTPGRVFTTFYRWDPEKALTNDLDVIEMKDVMNRSCKAKAEFLVGGIFSGTTGISIQLKMTNVCVDFIEHARPKMKFFAMRAEAKRQNEVKEGDSENETEENATGVVSAQPDENQ
jgi:Protein of unknown function (DUF2738)